VAGFVCAMEIAKGAEQFVWIYCGNTERYIFDNECDWLPFSFYAPGVGETATPPPSLMHWNLIPYDFSVRC